MTGTRCTAPVLIWRFDDDSEGPDIARRCFPKLFPQSEPALAALRLTEQLLGSHGISARPRDLQLRDDFSEVRRLSASERRLVTHAR